MDTSTESDCRKYIIFEFQLNDLKLKILKDFRRRLYTTRYF